MTASLVSLIWIAMEESRGVDSKVSTWLTIFVGICSGIMGAALSGFYSYWHSAGDLNYAVAAGYPVIAIIALLLVIWYVPGTLNKLHDDLTRKAIAKVQQKAHQDGLI